MPQLAQKAEKILGAKGKAQKRLGAKGTEEILYKAPKLIYTVRVC